MSSELTSAAERLRDDNYDSPGRVFDIVQQDEDRKLLANFALSLVRPDDGEPVDHGWLKSVGFMQDGDDGSTELGMTLQTADDDSGEQGMQLLLCADGTAWIETYDVHGTGQCLVEIAACPTRLAVRKLADALGIELKETLAQGETE